MPQSPPTRPSLPGGPMLALSTRVMRLMRPVTMLPIPTPDAVLAMETVTLGNVPQGILIRGQKRTNPILLFLHGGPGLPLMPFYYINANLESHFTVVHWDQRGAGKSYHPDIPSESMTIEQLVADAVELIRMLCQRFGQSRIYLVGHSWGSVLGMLIAQRYPELLHTYIGVGQVVDMIEGERRSYQFAMDNARQPYNQVAVDELEKIGPPPYNYFWDVRLERKWVNHYGGYFHQGMTLPRYYNMVARTPVYTVEESCNYFKGLYFTLQNLWHRLYYNTNLTVQIPRIEVPVVFCEGRHDWVVPSELAQSYFDLLDAPAGKSLVWFEQSAHWPYMEEPDHFYHVMVRQILQAQ